MRRNWKQLLRRPGSAILAIVLLVTTAWTMPVARAADAVESPVIAENSDGFYQVTFNYEGDAESVQLRGEIPGAGWDSGIDMTENDGVWSVTLENVKPGSYQYKFVIDGSAWIDDPANPAENEGGNSKLVLADKSMPEFESPVVDGKTVTFRYYAPDAEKAFLAGSMNGWSTNADALVKGDNGVWSLTKTLSSGVHEYKFVVDGNWYNDQVNQKQANGNNVVIVSGLAGAALEAEKGKPIDLPATLALVSADGAAKDVSPTYTLPEDLTGVTLADRKIMVSDEYTGNGFTVTASYEGYTSEVTVTIFSISADDVMIMLHYHRPDGVYDGWDAYTWVEGVSSGSNTFVPEEGGVVAAIVVPEGVIRIGFIIRKGGDSWADKDIQDDRFIEIPEMISGIVHIYVESGVKDFAKVYDDTAKFEHKPIRASYNEDGTVTVIMSGKIEDDLSSAFEIKDSGITITAVSEGKESDDLTWTYVLTLSEELELEKTYALVYKKTDPPYAIAMPNIYSTDAFEKKYTYTGDDLGATWTPEKTTFRVWAPTAQSLTVNLYKSGTKGTDDLVESIPMIADVNGTWVVQAEGDLNGIYYTYSVEVGAGTVETVDPYARTTGVNGNRAMVIDLDSTDPEGWDEDVNPNADLAYTDAVIYELHIRDLSSDKSSGIRNAGKFLGLTETGTSTPGGIPTGLDHIKNLGITHVHLLPVFDFATVDETKLDTEQFNWGYDPANYNVPEGSYSTDPYNGEVRVEEMKLMVKALHDNGISVIMDVVYNHVSSATTFSFNQLVPGYFSRIKDDGTYSNDSGCGNDTATERSMVRKYIVDSVNYWVDEYHIDGFRFDLVGLIDAQTVNEIVETVHKTHPDVIFYGEGWDMSTYVTKENVTMATQKNADKTPGFAYFSDDIRDAIKGSVFDAQESGYVSGATNRTEMIRNSFVANPGWTSDPTQIINYASCHDNNTLIDRLILSRPDASREDLIRMNNLAAAIYLTSEGIPFLQAGEEMLRTKPNADGSLNENSYNSPDSVNSIKWSTLEEEEYWNVYEYYKGLIAFRKAHGALRLTSAGDILANVTPVDGLPANVVAFEINGGVNGETASALYVIFNPNDTEQEITLPEGSWNVYINGEKAGTEVLETITGGTAAVAPISALVLVKEGPGTPDIIYSDVDDNAWYRDAVVFVTNAGLMVGYGNGRFGPNDTFTRAMLAVVLFKQEGGVPVNYLMRFDDVPADTWYTEAIRWAASEGIVSGYGNGKFGPGDPITREQFAVMLYNYERRHGGGLTGDWMFQLDYTDAAQLADWAYEAMCWCTMNGIIEDKDDSTLDPKGTCVRTDAAEILMNYFRYITKQDSA